jgi:hypothetical protein
MAASLGSVLEAVAPEAYLRGEPLYGGAEVRWGGASGGAQAAAAPGFASWGTVAAVVVVGCVIAMLVLFALGGGERADRPSPAQEEASSPVHVDDPDDEDQDQDQDQAVEDYMPVEDAPAMTDAIRTLMRAAGGDPAKEANMQSVLEIEAEGIFRSARGQMSRAVAFDEAAKRLLAQLGGGAGGDAGPPLPSTGVNLFDDGLPGEEVHDRPGARGVEEEQSSGGPPSRGAFRPVRPMVEFNDDITSTEQIHDGPGHGDPIRRPPSPNLRT